METVLNNRLIKKLQDLIRRPHLCDFPYYWDDNPIEKFRVYSFSQESSYTYFPDVIEKRFKFISKLNSVIKFKKTKFFSDKCKPVATITSTYSTQFNDSLEVIKNLKIDNGDSNKLNTLLIYVDGLSPCLLYGNEKVGAVMKRTHNKFKGGYIHEKYYSAAEWTLPNLASMFLGKLPSQHGLTNSESNYKTPFVIPRSQNIFQYLSRFGVSSSIFSSVPYMNPNFGFHLGTDNFFYHKNLCAKKLLPIFSSFVKNRDNSLNKSHLDCVFLMDVHHKLDGNLAKWKPLYDQFVESVSQSTRLTEFDTKKLIARAIELDECLNTFLDNEVLEFYDNIILVSDHGSARLRENQELCVDDARTLATFCLLSKCGTTIDKTKILSLASLPSILSRSFKLPIFPSLWSEENDVIFTQAIFAKLPYRLRIRTQEKYFDFVGENFWTDHGAFKSELNEFLYHVSSVLDGSKCVGYFKENNLIL